MKQQFVFFTGMLLILFFASATGNAQPQKRLMEGEGHEMEQRCDRDFGLNLTDEQKAQVKKIREDGYKVSKPLHDELRELKARQQTLITANNPDMNTINSNIDKMSVLQNRLAKIRTQHRQEIRSLLTNEQRMQFDRQKQQRMKRHLGKKKMMRNPGKGHSRPGRF